MTQLPNVPGPGVSRQASRFVMVPAFPPASRGLPVCESCRFRPAPLEKGFEDGTVFHVCPTCHPDWRDR